MSDVEAAFEIRWAQRRGLLPVDVEAVPPAPAALGEPRRGSMRLSPSGGPQTRMDGNVLPRPEPEPEVYGPTQDRGTAGGLLDMVANTFLSAQQGIVQAALEDAPALTDPEIVRLLREPGGTGDAPVIEDRDVSVAGRMRDAAARAQALGFDVAFRIGRGGQIEAVQRTPEMQAGGGGIGRVADAVGRLLGLGTVDLPGGVRAMQGMQ